MESAQMRLDKEVKDKVKKKKKRKEEVQQEEADRATLWNALRQTETKTREELEHLYWEQVLFESTFHKICYALPHALSSSVPCWTALLHTIEGKQ